MARYHAGRCPVREVVDVLLEAIEKADPKDYSPTGINNNLTSLSSLFYYEAALPPEEKPQYACRLEKMFSKSVSYLNDLPVNQYPRVGQQRGAGTGGDAGRRGAALPQKHAGVHAGGPQARPMSTL